MREGGGGEGIITIVHGLKVVDKSENVSVAH
jgi:hypothetical protein